MRRSLLTLTLLPSLLQAAPSTQGPAAPWLTFTTTHYRVHCPVAFESFGREVAGRIEGIHARYLDLVGFVYEKPGRPIDVLIQDPLMEPNGMAWPFLDRPHVVLWKTEPEADSIIGHHQGWAEILLTHELGHMHHILRPRRNPTLWEQLNASIGPLWAKAPRWVTEGYATVIEGKLTGSGRPHSAVRAAILRQWALEGKLPAYSSLSSTEGYLGGSMAYLVGSAYLAWLETQAQDPKVLQGLWTRLAGKRDFDASFLATFGFSAKDGYQRFCAELTHTALEQERRMKAQGLREGAVFTQLKGEVTDLSLSPDGTKLMARVLDSKKPGLYVWDLKHPAPKQKGPKVDADEPADHALKTPVVAPNWRLGRVQGALPWKPVWVDDHTLAFQLRLPDGEGMLRAEPWRWILGGGVRAGGATPAPAAPAIAWKEVDGIWNLVNAKGQPLTRTLAAARHPAPTPDGATVYYASLSATGQQIRRLDATQPPVTPTALPRDPAPLVADLVLPKADEPSPLPPPVPVQAHPYQVAESHQVLQVMGYDITPSGFGVQVGVGGNDMLGRLNWQALAGLGDGSGPRGAMVGGAWRGSTWAPSLQVFSLLERPSSQHFLSAQGFDRERRGLELAVEREDLSTAPWRLRPSLALERVAPTLGTLQNRSMVGLDARGSWRWSLNDLGASTNLGLLLQEGRTEGHAWRLSRLRVGASWINPWTPMALRAELGRVQGEPTALDRFHLGGQATSLLPSSMDANRVTQPALPSFSALGNRIQRLRVEGGAPLSLYAERVSLWEEGQPKPKAQRLVGLELDDRAMGLPREVLHRLLGRVSFTLGLHRPMDGIMKGRTVGTISLLVRP